MKKVEYRVRPVVRYNLTRYESEHSGGAIESLGEFDNHDMAIRAMNGMSAGQCASGVMLESGPDNCIWEMPDPPTIAREGTGI